MVMMLCDTYTHGSRNTSQRSVEYDNTIRRDSMMAPTRATQRSVSLARLYVCVYVQSWQNACNPAAAPRRKLNQHMQCGGTCLRLHDDASALWRGYDQHGKLWAPHSLTRLVLRIRMGGGRTGNAQWHVSE